MQINLTDKNEIEKTVEEFSDMIMRIAFQNVKQTSNAEDIMQEVFLALLKKRNFKNREHLKAWLIRVTINKCKDYLRSVTRREISLETVQPFVSVSEGETITEEIFALPADDRNIIYLHYYEGYSAAEIGRIIKKSENAVFIKLCRAREKLKDILEDNGNE